MSTEFSSIRLLDTNRLSPMSANINSGNENPIKIRISFAYKVTKEPQNCSENFRLDCMVLIIAGEAKPNYYRPNMSAINFDKNLVLMLIRFEPYYILAMSGGLQM